MDEINEGLEYIKSDDTNTNNALFGSFESSKGFFVFIKASDEQSEDFQILSPDFKTPINDQKINNLEPLSNILPSKENDSEDFKNIKIEEIVIEQSQKNTVEFVKSNQKYSETKIRGLINYNK